MHVYAVDEYSRVKEITIAEDKSDHIQKATRDLFWLA